MVSLRVANILLVVMSTLFAMSLASGGLFIVQAYVGMVLAGQIVGAATRPEQRPRWLQ